MSSSKTLPGFIKFIAISYLNGPYANSEITMAKIRGDRINMVAALQYYEDAACNCHCSCIN